MKHATSLLLAAGLAAAQSSTVVDVLMVFADSQTVDASIISAGPTATAFAINCPSGTPEDDCGLVTGVEVLYGPSTMTYTMSMAAVSVSVACKLDPPKDNADCSGVYVSGVSTSTLSEDVTGYSSYLMPVTVTAGLEKLSAATGGASNTGATDASTPTPTTLSTTGLPTGKPADSSASTDAATGTSSSTGGVARITQNAVVLGAAALVGGAMLM